MTWADFAIAITNTYGLVLIMIFLSYGVVAIPKKYFGMKDISSRLNFAYFNVYQKDLLVSDYKFKVTQLILQVLALKSLYIE